MEETNRYLNDLGFSEQFIEALNNFNPFEAKVNHEVFETPILNNVDMFELHDITQTDISSTSISIS